MARGVAMHMSGPHTRYPIPVLLPSHPGSLLRKIYNKNPNLATGPRYSDERYAHTDDHGSFGSQVLMQTTVIAEWETTMKPSTSGKSNPESLIHTSTDMS